MPNKEYITLSYIFSDYNNWQEYKTMRKLDNHLIQQVESMMRCGDYPQDIKYYICPKCETREKRAYRCKTRLCTHCGKQFADEWALTMERDLYEVIHRHMIFTVPSSIWPYLDEHRHLWKVMLDTVYQVLREMMSDKGWKEVIPGVICVFHPFGKDMKFNPHIHALVTEGGLKRDTLDEWINVTYFHYEKLRKKWQYLFLKNFRHATKNTLTHWTIEKPSFERYQNGFYVRAKDRVWNSKELGNYVVRYVRHPAIAESRIIGYDGKCVTFYYERMDDSEYNKQRVEITLPVMEFIDRIVNLAPPKGFKMIRHYGMYARNQKKKIKEVMSKLKLYNRKKEKKLNTLLQNVWEKICPNCGEVMMLEEIYLRTQIAYG